MSVGGAEAVLPFAPRASPTWPPVAQQDPTRTFSISSWPTEAAWSATVSSSDQSKVPSEGSMSHQTAS
jgi:hypothetical protein